LNPLAYPSLSVPPAIPPRPDALAPERPQANLASLPGLLFPNQGQYDDPVRFCLKDRNVTVFFTPTGFTLAAFQQGQGVAVRQEFLNARTTEPVASGENATAVNCLIGDEADWKPSLPAYRRVAYPNTWPDIDVIYEPRAQGLEYALVVRPGGDLRQVRLAYRGATARAEGDSSGRSLDTDCGSLAESAPIAFLSRDPGQTIPCSFREYADGTFGFDVGAYDPEQTLVIDPVISWSTFLGTGCGSSGAAGYSSTSTATYRPGDLALDGFNNIYVIGYTDGDFPTTLGVFDRLFNGGLDIFLTKVPASAADTKWTTFLTGGSEEWIGGFQADAAGNVYPAGRTNSPKFPTTPGALDPAYNGGADVFVVRLNP